MAMDVAQQSPSSHSLIEWILERNRRRLVCSVTQLAGAGLYEVAMQPLWDRASAVAETFHDPLTAFQRHAAIAASLRDKGWVVAAFTPPA